MSPGRGVLTLLTQAPLCHAGPATLEQLAVGAGAFCNVCQILITYFDNELLKNETLVELGDMLQKGCELLPAPLTGTVSCGERPPRGDPLTPLAVLTPLCPSQCEALVVQYEPEAVRLFVQMMDPTFVCTVSVPGAALTQTGILCPNLGVWERSSGIKVCSWGFFFHLPPFSFAMQKIKACDSSEEDLLGSDLCALGPQYWCKNMATATKCQVSVGHIPSPGLAMSQETLPPTTILPCLSCRLLSTAGVTYGTRSHLPAGCTRLAVLVQDPRYLPLGCTCTHGWQWQDPTSLTIPAGAVG